MKEIPIKNYEIFQKKNLFRPDVGLLFSGLVSVIQLYEMRMNIHSFRGGSWEIFILYFDPFQLS